MVSRARQETLAHLTRVRRYEAAGFRAWPATAKHYDGTWAIRLTASHPAKRLNSINPLDPNDCHHVDERVARAEPRFVAYNRPVIFRLSPLAGEPLIGHLDRAGWTRFDESLVMERDLSDLDLSGAIDQLPVRDVALFSAAHLAVRGLDTTMRPGVSEVVNTIQPDAGLFLHDEQGEPAVTAICVHDGDLAGLFEIATAERYKRRGLARQTVLSALKWARHRGARRAWLQVEADNAPALGLYEGLGFSEVYRYHYRGLPDALK